jgi:uncharacterized lipoprotein YddW (UPF0748 family)
MSFANCVARLPGDVRRYLLFAFVAFTGAAGRTARAQPAPPAVAREFRAAWISPTEAGDWPSRPGLSIDEQKAELRDVLDEARADGLNAVLLHVRTAADALYPTQRAPWSRYLVGRDVYSLGAYDGYDPLALAVAEAHARGLQLHVWFNPFRAMPPDELGRPVTGHVTRTHPEWVRRYGKSTWIDPGIPAARRAVLDAILEVVDRYDVDGVHLDDYFYPYLEQATITRTVKHGKHRRRITRHVTLRFPDDASWRRYGVARGWTDRGAWRRANVDDFVKTLYREVKARKEWLLVGISPFGIWRPGHPDGITGLDAYAETYADARRWLREGWVDYLAPQLYWPLDNYQQRFTRLDAWWRSENVLGRHLWPGLFTMRVGSQNDPWPADEIAHEVDALRAARRATTESLGHIHFRMGTLGEHLNGDSTTFGDALRAAEYAELALPPASPWLGNASPAMPVVAPPAIDEGVQPAGGGGRDDGSRSLGAVRAALLVTAGDSVVVRWWLVQTLGIDQRWTSRLLPRTNRTLALVPADTIGAAWIAVTAISRTGVAGAPALWRVTP